MSFANASLETEQLFLKTYTPKDFDSLAALLADPEVMRYSLKGPMSQEEVSIFVQKRMSEMKCIFAKEDGRFVGIVGLLHQVIDGIDELEISYRLKRAEWGKGFATEAAKAVRDWAFSHLDCERLVAIIEPANVRSASVAKRLSMTALRVTSFKGFPVEIYRVRKVRLEPYNPQWPLLFEEEKKRLEKILEGLPCHIFHIGSTAIVGAKAKPAIDMMLVVNQLSTFSAYDAALKKCSGYFCKGECGIRNHLFYSNEGAIHYHLHLYEEDHPDVQRHLRFVSYMNRHPKMADKYVALKEELANKYRGDRYNYTMKKSSLIKEIDYLAAKEADTWDELPSLGSKKNKWTKAAIIEALDANLHMKITYFEKYVRGSEIIAERDVTIVQSPVPRAAFNKVLAAKFSEENVASRIGQVKTLFESKHLPFYWYVGPFDLPGDLSQQLENQGFVLEETCVGMYREGNEIPDILENKDLLIKRVGSVEDFREFNAVHVASGGSPEAFDMLFHAVPPVLYGQGAPWEMYTGYFEGEPVDVAVLCFHAHAAGIYCLTTHPKMRRRGFAEAMMQHLLKRVQERGYFLTILHASSMGKKLYEKLGFQSCCIYAAYTCSS
jgi:GrpB-like predicted nucleotidyltransferase (UPF0157 family)/RimJ/RimL family protein N-acetyltransferase/GNAT superfamily N-acetyltransferase